jgi:hypothetical protein
VRPRWLASNGHAGFRSRRSHAPHHCCGVGFMR